MLLALLPTALALTPGETLDEGLAVHVTNQGLGRIGDAIAGLVPESLTVTGFAGELACDEGDTGAAPLEYGVTDLSLYITPQEVAIAASEGRLDFTLTLTLDTDPAELTAAGDCSILVGLDEVCAVDLPTAAMTVNFGMAMELIDGEIQVDADPIDMWVSPIGNPLEGCTLAKAIGTLLNQDPDFISNLIVSFVEPELEGLDTELETILQDAMSQLVIETEVDLLGTPLELGIEPSRLTLDDNGLFLGLGMTVGDLPLSDCVPAGDSSDLAMTGWPDLQTQAFDSTLQYDAAILLNKDMIDHLLWAVWGSGLFCLELSNVNELSEGTDIAINTDLLGTLLGTSEEFSELFGGENQDAAIALSSSVPPEAIFDDDIPIALDLGDLGIDFVVDLDGRGVRLAQIGFDEAIGIDPGISGTQIAPEIYLELDDLPLTESYNELLEPGFSRVLIATLPDLLGQFLPFESISELLPAFGIPTWNGIGLGAVFWIPDSEGQWLGGFALVDTESVTPIDVGGCDASGFGCDGFSDTAGGGADAFDFEELLGCSGEASDTGLAGCDSGCGGGDTGGDTGGASSDCGSCGGDSSCSATPRRRVFWPGWRVLMLVAIGATVLVRRRE